MTIRAGGPKQRFRNKLKELQGDEGAIKDWLKRTYKLDQGEADAAWNLMRPPGGQVVESHRSGKPQDPMTEWGGKTGRAYNRRFTQFWRQFEGETLPNGVTVAAVGRNIAPKGAKEQKVDLMFVHHGKREITVLDWTGVPRTCHLKKGGEYQSTLESQYRGYTVFYEERHWGLKNRISTVEALASDGTLYLPINTKPNQ